MKYKMIFKKEDFSGIDVNISYQEAQKAYNNWLKSQQIIYMHRDHNGNYFWNNVKNGSIKRGYIVHKETSKKCRHLKIHLELINDYYLCKCGVKMKPIVFKVVI